MLLLAATTLLFLITTLLFAFRPQSAPVRTSASRAAAEAQTERSIEEVASRFLKSLVTYDVSTIDKDVERMLADTTPSVETEYQSALNGNIETFKKSVSDQQSQSSGEVFGVTVSDLDDDTATVFAIVSQTKQSAQRPEDRTSIRAIELSMLRTDEGWKVDNLANPTRPGA